MDQSAKDAVKKLIADGKISEEEAQEYFPDLINRADYLADALHLLMCKYKHNDNVTNMGDPTLCDYYVEQQLDQGEIRYTISTWREHAQEVIELLKLDTINRVNNFIKDLGAFYSAYEKFTAEYPDAIDYVWEVISQQAISPS